MIEISTLAAYFDWRGYAHEVSYLSAFATNQNLAAERLKFHSSYYREVVLNSRGAKCNQEKRFASSELQRSWESDSMNIRFVRERNQNKSTI